MEIQTLFETVKNLIAENKFDQLSSLKASKPEKFNWVKDIFEPQNVKENPNDKALLWIYKEQREDYTFEQVADKYNQFLNFLRKNGIKKGDKLFSQLPLYPINWFAYLACIKGGQIIVPAATTLEVRDLEFRFDRIHPEIALADGANAAKIDEAAQKVGHEFKLKLIVGEDREGWVNISQLDLEATEAEGEITDADDDLFYFFTSGTTGMPKVVVHSHFTYPVGHLTTTSWIGLKRGDLHYNISQPGWAKFFWSSFFAPWNVGATILGYHTDRFNPKEQLQNIQDLGVTTFCAPPTALRVLIQEDLQQYQFKLRACVAAGEPLNPEIIDTWRDATGVTIRDGYGQTEATAIVGNLPGNAVKSGSMGKPTFLYDVIIADDEGNEVANTEEGNICIRYDENTANGIFKTYLVAKDLLPKVFKHGLYFTGDKAHKDEDGYVWFVGRDDDVIKASDFRVGPFEVESVLLEHDAVQEAAVVASPHELRGNAVKAYVILADGFEANEQLAQELFDYAEQHLARYKIPRIIEFTSSLPKTISGKIRRVELRAKEEENRRLKNEIELEFFHSKY